MKPLLWISLLLSSCAANAGSITAVVTNDSGVPLADAVVYAVGATPVSLPAAKAAEMDQRNKEFVPRVMAVQTGAAVQFPNSDNIRHQVYSFSPAKTFNLKLYSGRAAAPVVFDKPGVVVLGCNIHDHMVAWVVSVETPWFARTDARGAARIADLPPGEYQLKAWHPGLTGDAVTAKVTVTSGELEHEFTLAAAMPGSPGASAGKSP